MKYLSVFFLVFIVIVIILADHGGLPSSISALYNFPYGDKVGHFILFGLLDFFLTRAFLSSHSTRPRGRVTVLTGLILALFIFLEEWSQQFFVTRTFDMFDLLASYLGVVIGGWAAWKIKK
jgi:VanZ family protein